MADSRSYGIFLSVLGGLGLGYFLAAQPVAEEPSEVADSRRAVAGPTSVKSVSFALAENTDRLLRLERLVEEVQAQLERVSQELSERGQQGEEVAGVAESNEGVSAGGAEPRGVREAIDYTKSAEERALLAAGVEPEVATQMKRRRDQLAMAEVYLRDQAMREGWYDTPRFREEMEDLAGQRISIRQELGDDSFDHYLFALGRPNRVRVDDVMFQSVAEEVGLRPGDMIVSYDGSRLFAPEDLVNQTHAGEIGDMVRLEVIRDRQPLELDVPRGPLGVRVGATQDMPLE